MSDDTLLVYGCVVFFIAVAGAYVYFREAFRVRGRQMEQAQREEQAHDTHAEARRRVAT